MYILIRETKPKSPTITNRQVSPGRPWASLKWQQRYDPSCTC